MLGPKAQGRAPAFFTLLVTTVMGFHTYKYGVLILENADSIDAHPSWHDCPSRGKSWKFTGPQFDWNTSPTSVV